MTAKEVRENYDVLYFFYKHKEEDFEHRGFKFKKGEYYLMHQDEGGLSLVDDFDEWHEVSEEANNGKLGMG